MSTQDSNLVKHAKYELEAAGLFDTDSDYDGMLGKAALELIETFDAQGHSGASASLVGSIFYRLLQYKPLTALREDDDWIEVTSVVYSAEDQKAGKRKWQSARNPAVFSEDGGKTWIDMETKEAGKSLTKEEVDEARRQAEELNREESATESGATTQDGAGEEQQGVGSSQSTVEDNEQPDTRERPEAEAKGGTPGKKTGKKGGKKK